MTEPQRAAGWLTLDADVDAGRAAGRPGRLTRLLWVSGPRAVARRSQSLMIVALDGHYLTALRPVGGILPLIGLVVGFFTGWQTWGFDVTITENLWLVVALLAMGVLSGAVASYWLVGFVVGNFLLANTSWWLAPPQRWLDDFIPGFFELPLAASLIYERLPLVIHYLLIGLLIIGLPTGARMIVASLAERIVGSEGARLFILAALSAVALLILARFWSVAAPHVIRPLFTWGPVWAGDRTPPAGAITPVQDEARIGQAGAAVMLLRFSLVWLIGRRPVLQRRVRAVEIELRRRHQADPETAKRPGPRRLVFGALVSGAVSIMLVAGLLDSPLAGLIVFALFTGARLVRVGFIPFPSAGWRAAMDHIPVAMRFAGGMLLVQGLASALVGVSAADQTLQTLVWPMTAGMLVMALLIPSPQSVWQQRLTRARSKDGADA